MVTSPECHAIHICQLMIRVIMWWYRGLCIDILGFTFQLRKTRKHSTTKPWMKAVQPVIPSNWVPYFQIRSERSHSTSGSGKLLSNILLLFLGSHTDTAWIHLIGSILIYLRNILLYQTVLFYFFNFECFSKTRWISNCENISSLGLKRLFALISADLSLIHFYFL